MSAAVKRLLKVLLATVIILGTVLYKWDMVIMAAVVVLVMSLTAVAALELGDANNKQEDQGG